MSNAKHTKGPYRECTWQGVCNSDEIAIETEGGNVIGSVWPQGEEDRSPEQEANAKLWIAAPDHAMYAEAVTAGVARWEPFGVPGKGEVCVGGMRYATNLDDFGVPELNSTIRAAIARATE